MFDCEFPVEDEVGVEVAVGMVEVSTRIPLLDAAPRAKVDDAKLVAVAVPLRAGDEEDVDVEDVDSLDEVEVADEELALLLTAVLEAAGALVVAAAVVLSKSPPSTLFAFGHSETGPPPDRNVDIMFPSSMSLFPQAVFTLEVNESSAFTQAVLQVPEEKSEAWQPLMDCVYTVWQLEGRSDTRGVKSERLTARIVVGSARSASVGRKNRMLIELKGRRGRKLQLVQSVGQSRSRWATCAARNWPVSERTCDGVSRRGRTCGSCVVRCRCGGCERGAVSRSRTVLCTQGLHEHCRGSWIEVE